MAVTGGAGLQKDPPATHRSQARGGTLQEGRPGTAMCGCGVFRPPHVPQPHTTGRRAAAQPSWKGSRVPPVSSTKTDLVSVYSLIASMPFSRPRPLCPKPPKGMLGATTR